MLNYDAIQDWGTSLSDELRGLIPNDLGAIVSDGDPNYIEDAMTVVLEVLGDDRRAVIDKVDRWIEGQTVAAVHGSRLTQEEAASVRVDGLEVLRANARTERLRRKLAGHARWTEVAGKLDSAILTVGAGCRKGRRELAAYATLSRVGLLRGFNHFLTHGSEFDQEVAHLLLGDDGLLSLKAHGNPVIFHLALPGRDAVKAANPNGLFKEEMGNLTRQFLRAWSWWLAYPDFRTDTEKVDCGFTFSADVPPKWIVETEWILDHDLDRMSI
ncbi:hypothetical protein JHL17_32140 [Azospirillum sp. YIM B02556]|uniref:Uncharacterized protein n=1 Tax=Azospirillum endophyticum TaxID=2800326 RepID=A0ABS1FFQ3_9PROT|nr:hypothetical protein [Azospirillum endophyticum]MBK1842057.1 hypothetical protein [Azospirillum endophyticum]